MLCHYNIKYYFFSISFPSTVRPSSAKKKKKRRRAIINTHSSYFHRRPHHIINIIIYKLIIPVKYYIFRKAIHLHINIFITMNMMNIISFKHNTNSNVVFRAHNITLILFSSVKDFRLDRFEKKCCGLSSVPFF